MVDDVYKCMYCESQITKDKYNEILRQNEILKKKIDSLEKERQEYKEKEKRFEEEREKLKKQMQDNIRASIAKERQKLNVNLIKYQNQIKTLKEKESKFKDDLKRARSQEKIKFGNQLSKYQEIMRKQEEQIKNLKEGKTAQELGFDFENKMYDIIKREFQEDEVQHTGKKGDVLLKIKLKNYIIGTILIECKRKERHSALDVDEVKRHKISAKADVGILVTNADFGKRKMDGFCNIEDVLVIRPHSAVDFIRHIRKTLLDINSLKISKDEKNLEMTKLWKFIHSAEFESQMNSIIREVQRLQELDSEELKIIDKRKQIESNLLKAHDLISEGIKNSKRKG